MIHEQRTSSRFGKISEPHCRQKSWNIHCGNNDIKQKSPLREFIYTFSFIMLHVPLESDYWVSYRGTR